MIQTLARATPARTVRAGWLLLNFPLLALWDRDVMRLRPAAVAAGAVRRLGRADRPGGVDRRGSPTDELRRSTPCSPPAGRRRVVRLPAAAVRGGVTSATARARDGRSIIGNAWVYTLSLGVYCTAWTYFGSVGRAAASGLWFLPIYLGPTLAMLLAWMVLRKMIRIARSLPHHLDRRLHRQPLRQEPAAGRRW